MQIGYFSVDAHADCVEYMHGAMYAQEETMTATKRCFPHMYIVIKVICQARTDLF